MTITIPAPGFFDLLSFFIGAGTLFAVLYGVDVFREWLSERRWRKLGKAQQQEFGGS